MNDCFYRLLPKKALSQLMYRAARIETPWLKNRLIRLYQHITGATTSFAAEKNPLAYPSLNAFFTRALATDARPIASEKNSFISPVDGRCAIFGEIKAGQLFQAKTQRYSLAALLNDAAYAEQFEHGQTATLYLAPDDYHRIHMPCDGELTAMTFCPGNRHSVALDLLERIPNLFAGNERLVCHFTTDFGELALVMVGALNVSSIETVWHGELHDNGDNHYRYDAPIAFKKGEEIGRFNLGSTVILCCTAGALHWTSEKLSNGEKIFMGEAIAIKANH